QVIHRGTKQQPLNYVIEKDGYLSWPIWAYHPHENYGYPFGLDFHIYRRSLISSLLEQIEYKNTSELESQLTTRFRNKVDELRSFKNSCAVNLPLNCAGGVTRAGEINPVSLENLNEKYLDGYIIDIDDISKQNIKGCHQEIPIKFVRL